MHRTSMPNTQGAHQMTNPPNTSSLVSSRGTVWCSWFLSWSSLLILFSVLVLVLKLQPLSTAFFFRLCLSQQHGSLEPGSRAAQSASPRRLVSRAEDARRPREVARLLKMNLEVMICVACRGG